MKKLRLLTVLFIAIGATISSCKKDNDDNNNKDLLKGNWRQVKEVDSQYLNNNLQYTNIDTTFDANEYIEITNDKIIYHGEDYQESYTIDGTLVKTKEIGGDDTDEFTIKELSSSKLVIEYTYEYKQGNQTIKEVSEETYQRKN